MRLLETRLQLDGFSYPFPEDGDDDIPQRRINNKFFTQNLEDNKVAAMQFFGDHLYLLYNNEREIRAFDQLGNQVNKWKLPVAVENFERTWEGMRLEEDGTDLYLHLALDSPPQLWTIKVGDTTNFPWTNSTGAHWDLPECAKC